MGSFLLLLILILLFATLLKIQAFFSLIYLLIAFYFLSRAWTWFSFKNVRYQRTLSSHAFFGEQVVVELTIRNVGWLPVPWLEIHDSLPIELTSPPFFLHATSLGPYAQHTFRYTLNGQRRGYFEIGPLQLKAGSLYGAQTVQKTIPVAQNITVYPRILPLQALGLPTRSPLVALPAHHPLFEDPARITGLRDYQRGDSPRRIHWPATARARKILVKQYQPAISRETLICLNLNENEYEPRERFEAEDLGIVTAASIANHIVNSERLAAGLLTDAWDPYWKSQAHVFFPPRREHAHLTIMLETLARVQMSSAAQPFAHLLRQSTLRLGWGTTIAVITGNENEVLFDALAGLQRSGFAVALILVRPHYSASNMQQRAAQLGISIYRVWQDRDLWRWR